MDNGRADNQITRRDFIGGVAANAIGLAVAGTLIGAAAATATGCSSSSESSSSSSGTSSTSTASSTAAATDTSATAPVDERYTADLTDMFADKAAFDAEVARLEDEAIPALQKAADQVSDEASLVAYLKLYDQVNSAASMVFNYGQLRFYIDSTDTDAQIENSTAERVAQEVDLVMATVNAYLVALDEETWQKYLSSADLSTWHRYLQKTYDNKNYVLPAASEALLQGAMTAQSNVSSLFTTMDSTDFYLSATTDPSGNDVTMTNAAYSSAMSSSDRDYRERAFKTYYSSLSKMGDIFAGNLNTYVKLCEDLSAAHGFDSDLQDQLSQSDINEQIFDELITGTLGSIDAYAESSELRAKTLGIDELMPWDRNVALSAAPDISFAYDDVQPIILDALAPLGSDYAARLKEIFSNRWIDVYPTAGKSGGAATMSGMTGHPYIFMSYTDDFASLDTLVHELGHMIHYEYSNAAQESTYDKSALTITAEVASTTNEVLLMDYLIDHAKDDAEKFFYITKEIAIVEVSFFRQAGFASFEQQLHQTVLDGDVLGVDAVNSFFNDMFAKFYPGITVTDENGIGWAYVNHFYLNYYVQSYAFAAAGAFNAAYDIENGGSDALSNYMEFLAAGNSLPATELYSKLGIDLTAGGYITPLIDKYRSLLDEAKALQ